MHTEYTLKFEFHTPNRDAMTTFIRACREATRELSMQGAILSGDTPIISFTVENNEIGTKKLKIFNGGE
jgi:hypothetical protein